MVATSPNFNGWLGLPGFKMDFSNPSFNFTTVEDDWVEYNFEEDDGIDSIGAIGLNALVVLKTINDIKENTFILGQLCVSLFQGNK